jgi:hypothetical protein
MLKALHSDDSDPAATAQQPGTGARSYVNIDPATAAAVNQIISANNPGGAAAPGARPYMNLTLEQAAQLIALNRAQNSSKDAAASAAAAAAVTASSAMPERTREYQNIPPGTTQGYRNLNADGTPVGDPGAAPPSMHSQPVQSMVGRPLPPVQPSPAMQQQQQQPKVLYVDSGASSSTSSSAARSAPTVTYAVVDKLRPTIRAGADGEASATNAPRKGPAITPQAAGATAGYKNVSDANQSSVLFHQNVHHDDAEA